MKKAIFGFGGHAREVASQMNEEVTFFVDDAYMNDMARPVSSFDPNEYELMVAIADPKNREKIVNSLPIATKYFTFIHPTALLMDSNTEIGEGTFIGAYCILTTKIKLGKHSILNRANQIGHDTVSDDYLSMMPGSIFSGNCKVGKRVYIGTNSSVREKINICDDVIIGLNSGVVSDIKDSAKYGGTPAKKLNNIKYV
jgi:sugar O-acyltransferase (sialic acid O-acetyltransferase NeuD family)